MSSFRRKSSDVIAHNAEWSPPPLNRWELAIGCICWLLLAAAAVSDLFGLHLFGGHDRDVQGLGSTAMTILGWRVLAGRRAPSAPTTTAGGEHKA